MTSARLTPPGKPFWAPDPEATTTSRIADFGRWVTRQRGIQVAHDHTDYPALHRWSVTDLEGFWSAVWEYFDVDAATPYEQVLAEERMPGARWFTGATLNYTHHALRHLSDDRPAIIALDETGAGHEVSGKQLRAQVASVAATLRDLGVGPGDRVVGYLPNTPHAMVAFLAAAGIGAVWSVCGQDYAPKAAADRFTQLEPTVLIAADGYLFNGATHDRREAVLELARALPTLEATVLVDHVGLAWPQENYPALTVPWEDASTRTEQLTCTPVPFDHPLWILFSSGTTGLPKGIVHGHGGVVLEHLKTLGLQSDLGPGDRLLWYTTTHWMMWNLAVSTLLTGAATCTYDGSPAPLTRPGILWELAARHHVTLFGTSPQYLLGMAKFGIDPSVHDLSSVRAVGCTGSTLPASAYPWVRDHLGERVQLASSSGGTDVVSGFAGSAPTTPVWAGELSVPYLGVALAAYDTEGRPVVDEVGELVVTRPMPSMPLYFWNDPDGSRYRDAYFTGYPGAWRHGDWITLTSHGSVIVHGRSDSTLKPQRRTAGQRRHPRRRRTPPRDHRSPGHRRRGTRRRLLDAPVRRPRRRSGTGRRPQGQDPPRHPYRCLTPPRARRDPPGPGHPPHPYRQEARSTRQAPAPRRPRRPGRQPRGCRQPRPPRVFHPSRRRTSGRDTRHVISPHLAARSGRCRRPLRVGGGRWAPLRNRRRAHGRASSRPWRPSRITCRPKARSSAVDAVASPLCSPKAVPNTNVSTVFVACSASRPVNPAASHAARRWSS